MEAVTYEVRDSENPTCDTVKSPVQNHHILNNHSRGTKSIENGMVWHVMALANGYQIALNYVD
jgi:hypothetical protein